MGCACRSTVARNSRASDGTDTPAELGVQDYVVITLKAHGISDAVPSIRPLLGPVMAIVPHRGATAFRIGISIAETRSKAQCLTRSIRRHAVADAWPRARDRLRRPPATEVVAPASSGDQHGRSFPWASPRASARSESSGCSKPADSRRRSAATSATRSGWEGLGNLCLNPISALTCADGGRRHRRCGRAAAVRAMMTEAAAIAADLGIRLRHKGARWRPCAGRAQDVDAQDLERGRSRPRSSRSWSRAGVAAASPRIPRRPSTSCWLSFASARKRRSSCPHQPNRHRDDAAMGGHRGRRAEGTDHEHRHDLSAESGTARPAEARETRAFATRPTRR